MDQIYFLNLKLIKIKPWEFCKIETSFLNEILQLMSNILIGLDGNIRLCDFGFSCYNSGKTLCGTVDYIAPEIITNKQYDHTIDYWSLGILLYEM